MLCWIIFSIGTARHRSFRNSFCIILDLRCLELQSRRFTRISTSMWISKLYHILNIRCHSDTSQGGQVASNFVANYRAAKSAGVARIDAYMFPCTGTQPTGVACKSPATQLSEFLNAIDSNGMTLGTLWFDIEPTSGTCNAWNLGATQNTALARQWVSLLQGSGRKWGIYANG